MGNELVLVCEDIYINDDEEKRKEAFNILLVDLINESKNLSSQE